VVKKEPKLAPKGGVFMHEGGVLLAKKECNNLPNQFVHYLE